MKRLITYLCVIATVAVAAPLLDDSLSTENTYDQRQTGQINIRLNIKDLAIISLGKDSFSGSTSSDDTLYDDDYDYDMNQLTINPALGIFGVPPTNKPTPKPTVSSEGMTGKPPQNIQEIIHPPQPQHDEYIHPMIIKPLHEDNPTSSDDAVPTVTIKPSSMPPPVIIGGPPTTSEPAAITPPRPMTTKMPSVVIIQESTAAPMAPKPEDIPAVDTEIHKYSSQYSQQIPVHVVVEPVLRPKISPTQKSTYMINRFSKKPSVEIVTRAGGDDEKVKRIQNTYDSESGLSKCTAGTFLDRSGRCRVRRSGL